MISSIFFYNSHREIICWDNQSLVNEILLGKLLVPNSSSRTSPLVLFSALTSFHVVQPSYFLLISGMCITFSIFIKAVQDLQTTPTSSFERKLLQTLHFLKPFFLPGRSLLPLLDTIKYLPLFEALAILRLILFCWKDRYFIVRTLRNP